MMERSESIIARASIAIVATCVVVQAFTASWYPTWIDDVMQTEPAVNWALGRGFVSCAQALPGDKLYPYNNSLYPFLLAPWVKALGIGYWQVRLFDLLLALIAIVLAVRASRNMGLLKGMAACAAATAIALCVDSTSFVYRSGRADSATMLASALVVLAYSRVRDGRAHWAWMALPSLLLAPSGIQSFAFMAALAMIARLLDPKFRWMHAVGVAAGAGLGLTLLVGYYFLEGVHVIFLQTTFGSGQSIIGASLQTAVIQDSKALKYLSSILERMAPAHMVSEFLRDASMCFLMVGLAAIVAVTSVPGRTRAAAVNSLAVACIVPAIMLLAGRYPGYYVWMASIPVAIGFVAASERLVAGQPPRWLSRSMVGLGACAVLQGFPLQVAQELRSFGPTGHAQVAAMCAEQLRDGDVVYGANVVYFEVKRRNLGFFGTLYAEGRAYPEMSERERSSVTVVIVPEPEAEASLAKLKGTWRQTGEFPIHIGMSEWLSKPVKYVAFRRTDAP